MEEMFKNFRRLSVVHPFVHLSQQEKCRFNVLLCSSGNSFLFLWDLNLQVFNPLLHINAF